MIVADTRSTVPFSLRSFFDIPPAIIACMASLDVKRSSCSSNGINGNFLRKLLIKMRTPAVESVSVLSRFLGIPFILRSEADVKFNTDAQNGSVGRSGHRLFHAVRISLRHRGGNAGLEALRIAWYQPAQTRFDRACDHEAVGFGESVDRFSCT